MSVSKRVRNVGPIETTPLFDIVIDLAPRLNIGRGPFGHRVFYGAAGGSFEGPRLRGEVLPIGSDWALFRPDQAITLDVRLILHTHDDALIQMTYGGRWITPPGMRQELADTAARHRIDPAHYYFRTNPLFETGAEQYSWLNDIVCVGSGYAIEGGIAYRVHQIL
jgi:hypothetical protein